MRVLVVEDDRALADVVRRGLSEEGWAIDVAGSGRDAREAVDLNPYDVIVLDLGLPDTDGATLCREWRAASVEVPILMLTARAGTWDKVGGLDAGADDYLPKPFDFPELSARLRALARRPVGMVPAVLDASGVRLDPATRQVWRGTSVVPLTTKEFAVLEHLMRHAGTVVTRSELIDHVWDANYDGLSNIIDVNIASLRRKLDVGGDPAPIETLRGAGYRFGEPASGRST